MIYEEKYSKAKEQFQFIIYNNPGSTIASKSQYYLAESYYRLENYNQASREYDKFTMISQDPELVAKSKFLTCKCLYLLSSDSNKDQHDTQFTINKIQLFLEEYPNTGHKFECQLMIEHLRGKLAKKDIDSGRLYLRMEKYQSALIYFNLVLSEYWDTNYTDEALYNIIISYVLDNKIEEAEFFFHDNKDKFKDKDIVIAGGGDSALDWVLDLHTSAKSLTLVHRRKEFRAVPDTVNKVQELNLFHKVTKERGSNSYPRKNIRPKRPFRKRKM